MMRQTSTALAQPRILYVDAYDSFSNNVVGLLENTINAKVTTVRIDDHSAATNLSLLIKHYDAVVVGPGPGHPGIPDDIGFVKQLWELSDEHMLPIFGVCLGFQSLALAFGATVERLREPRHGIVVSVHHVGTDIFEGVGDFDATLYHSLRVRLTPTDAGSQTQLVPLASECSSEENGEVLMALRHASKPFWGCQFHPESVCTTKPGHQMIRGWWREASKWINQKNPQRIRGELPRQLNVSAPAPLTEEPSPETTCRPVLSWRCFNVDILNAVDICETLRLSESDCVILDSQGHASGAHSIIGIVIPERTSRLTYSVDDHICRAVVNGREIASSKLGSVNEMWSVVRRELEEFRASRDVEATYPSTSPFWGGYMGYLSYELGLETLDVSPPGGASSMPDVNMVFVERSIVVDHHRKQIIVQSLLEDDMAWISNVGQALTEAAAVKSMLSPMNTPNEALESVLQKSTIKRPHEEQYREQVLNCQEYMRSGDSYELCLTGETEVGVPTEEAGKMNVSWELYKNVRKRNPAPFGAFLRLDPATVISSSPERFLSWSRDGVCQFRPIKGTVKKAPGVTRADADRILGSSKEQAENLMIVDLIRHDLAGVIGAKNTEVTKLMVVEEYQTVYQLVSVIEGHFGGDPSINGIDVLKASLPPGSMTGAPKKRSCEILTGLEKRRRGIYSGVLGYMDIGGAGDFSVVIRTAFHQDGDAKMENRAAHDIWRIGAGGAVTVQSTDIGEFEEMETKLSSVLAAFRNVC